MPLLIMSSGDSSVSALFSAWPILHDSLPHRTLVAGGTTFTRTVASHSGFGRLIDAYAPSENVGTEYGAGSTITQVEGYGSSFAAPQLAGIAGLLLAFDSTLTPDSLKAFIVRGASNGGRVIHDPDGTTHYLANAYESLKIAAARPGAPLCGNHVWIAGGQVIAQRGNSTEVLGSTVGPHGWAANAFHGGHRIQYSDSTAVRTLDYGIPHWVAGPTANISDSISGGTYGSVFLHSHGGDTTVALSFTDSTTNGSGQPVQRIFIALTDTHGSTEKDTSLDVPLGPAGQNEGGSAGNCPSCYFPRLAGTFSVRGAFSPRSIRFLVAINRDTAAVTISGPTGGCSQRLHTELCGGVGQNTAQYVYTPEKASIYEVKISTQAPWFTITQESTLSGVWIYWAGLGESDLESTAGIGSEQFTNYFNDPRENQPVVRVVTACNIEYRDGLLATISGGQAPAPTNDACPPNNTDIGGGTISPSIVKAPTQVSSRRDPGSLLFHP